ncbi:MAG: hypothetical protein K0R50_1293 [Eubacterium sp.]|jgi:ABC-2 type transport system permease protein|nr:hypothetical protein [Eubacterium sp.]
MKLAASMAKTLKENIRDWKVLIMVLVFSPFFVLLMNLYYGSEPTTYNIGIINFDSGNKSTELIRTMENTRGEKDTKIFRLSESTDREQLENQIKDKSIDLGMVIPENYSKKLVMSASDKNSSSVAVELLGSMGNMRYTVAAVLSADIVYKQGIEVARITLPTTITETFLEKKQPLNEFDNYVPGMISLAILMILFTACASIVKENDKRTLVRLKLSRLGAFNFLLGICIVQAVIAVIALVLSYWTALGLGYKPVGEFGPVLVVGIISSFSMVAVSLLVASFLNSVFDVLTIGCFPFFIMMFFSGSMFPLPKINLFTLGGHSFGVTDVLPLTHTASAFNKILNFGGGISDVGFDIAMIGLLSLIYFTVGIILYNRRKLSRA